DGGGARGSRNAGRDHAGALGADGQPPEQAGALSAVIPLRVAPALFRRDFDALLRGRGIELPPLAIDTLQVNITKLCNQQCRHCHVDASPARREMMSAEGIAKCLEILERNPRIGTLDITGGAPELHPGFDGFVERATAL